jgi:hypothetical protein
MTELEQMHDDSDAKAYLTMQYLIKKMEEITDQEKQRTDYSKLQHLLEQVGAYAQHASVVFWYEENNE